MSTRCPGGKRHQWSVWNPERHEEQEMVVDVKRRWRSKRQPDVTVNRKVMCVKCGRLKLKEPNNLHKKVWPTDKDILIEAAQRADLHRKVWT